MVLGFWSKRGICSTLTQWLGWSRGIWGCFCHISNHSLTRQVTNSTLRMFVWLITFKQKAKSLAFLCGNCLILTPKSKLKNRCRYTRTDYWGDILRAATLKQCTENISPGTIHCKHNPHSRNGQMCQGTSTDSVVNCPSKDWQTVCQFQLLSTTTLISCCTTSQCKAKTTANQSCLNPQYSVKSHLCHQSVSDVREMFSTLLSSIHRKEQEC